MHDTIIKFKNIIPRISSTSYLAPGCKIIGDVTIGENSSIWFNTVIRGDVAPIIIGNNTNIQDNSVIHTSRHSNGETIIGNNVTIGHMSIIHACYIQDYAFIGMGAIIMDNAIIEPYGFVAAGSLITSRKIIKSKELWQGKPAKFIRYIDDSEVSELEDNNKNYVKLKELYKFKSV